MLSPFTIIEALRGISGTNDKLAYLKANTNPLFERAFHLAYSSEYVFGIRKIPTYRVNNFGSISLDQALDVLESSFATRAVTGKAAVQCLTDLLEKLYWADAHVLACVIKGNFDCGINVTNANKCMSKPVPTFSTMLCAKQDQKLIDKLFANNDVIVQTKSDGMRVIVSVDNKRKVRYRTRNGKDLTLPAKYNEYFSQFPGLCFDGEMMISSGNSFEERKVGNGILNSIRQGKASPEDAGRVRFVLWDVINYDDYMTGYSSKQYEDRYEDLFNISRSHPNTSVWQMVKTDRVSNFKQAQHLYMEAREAGEEGVILKDPMAPFEAKRVNHQIKMKAEETLDLRVVDIQEGTGKYQGMLGAVICQDQSGDLEVRVGSGFDDQQRKELFTQKFIGSIVEVKYNEVISSNGKDTLSLFLPIFDRIRDDKKIADTVDKNSKKVL